MHLNMDETEVPLFIAQYSRHVSSPNIRVNPGYIADDENYEHDIVLMYLEDPVAISDYPSLGSLPEIARLNSLSASQRNEIVTALGWGETDNGTLSDKLQQVTLDYIPRNTCNSQWGSQPITGNMICAAETSEPLPSGQDTCRGDSGGPLFTGATRNPEVIGLTSFGTTTCGTAVPPAVYTNVAAYLTWLEQLTLEFGEPIVDVAATLPTSVRSGIGTTTKLTMNVRNASVFNETQDIHFTVNVPAGTVIDNVLLDGSPASCTGIASLTCDVADTLSAGSSHGVTMDITHTGNSAIHRTLVFNVTHNRFDYRSLNNTDVEVPLTFSDAPVGGGGGSSGGALFYMLPWLALGAWLRRRKWSVSQRTSSSASSSGAR
ncbi:Serine endopeptidase/trypsin-like serine proteinase family protein [Alcanivorax sp. S71-1-4]|nr:Serine endopeptidase/trypsin-like serine proteinase family protein [Alcanivorax sp. S71-1-4]